MVLHAHELGPAVFLRAELHLGKLNIQQCATTRPGERRHTWKANMDEAPM